MRNYEKPMAIMTALTSDVILTSTVLLNNDGNGELLSLATFNWND